jgi:hypothetical protein
MDRLIVGSEDANSSLGPWRPVYADEYRDMMDKDSWMIGVGSVDSRGDSVKKGTHRKVRDMELTVSFGAYKWGLAWGSLGAAA